jgi:HAMP domain-containing protein
MGLDPGREPRGIARWRPATWRAKLLLLLLAFAIAPLAVQAVWDYLAMRRAFERSTLEAMQGLARAKAQALEQLTIDRRLQVERIAGLLAPHVLAVTALPAIGVTPRTPEPGDLPRLRDAEVLPTTGPAAPASADATPAHVQRPSAPLRELREALVLLLWDQRQFEELLVIDTRGRVIASTHEGHEGHDASVLDYFRNGMGSTFVQPVFLSPITDQLTMVISTPIRDPGRGVQGVLAARLNLARVFQVVGETTGLGETGEAVAGRRDGDRVVFTAPTRHDAEAALQRSVALGGEPAVPLQQATQGRSGSGRAVDYRGVDVLAAWEPVPSLGWGLVVKIDRAEALSPAVRASARMLALTLPLLLGVFVVSLLASRALVQPLAELRSAADRISRGDFDVQIDIPSRDEIGQLADSFERMVAAIKFFRERRDREEDEALYEDESVEPGEREGRGP